MLDADLAKLYGVPVKALNQAVKRNADRFPGDFMFTLARDEVAALRSQNVTLDDSRNRTPGRGKYAKYVPHAFTKYDRQFKVVFDAIRELMSPPAIAPKRRIGFASDA